jgi:hypothetical protein
MNTHLCVTGMPYENPIGDAWRPIEKPVVGFPRCRGVCKRCGEQCRMLSAGATNKPLCSFHVAELEHTLNDPPPSCADETDPCDCREASEDNIGQCWWCGGGPTELFSPSHDGRFVNYCSSCVEEGTINVSLGPNYMKGWMGARVYEGRGGLLY